MDLRAKTCCFTGHRSLSGEEKLKAAVRLRRVIEEQIKAGIVFYGAGGAIFLNCRNRPWMSRKKMKMHFGCSRNWSAL